MRRYTGRMVGPRRSRSLRETNSHLNIEVESGGRRVSVCLTFQRDVITFFNGARRQNLQVYLLSGVWKRDKDRRRQSMKARGRGAAWDIQASGIFLWCSSCCVPVVSSVCLPVKSSFKFSLSYSVEPVELLVGGNSTTLITFCPFLCVCVMWVLAANGFVLFSLRALNKVNRNTKARLWEAGEKQPNFKNEGLELLLRWYFRNSIHDVLLNCTLRYLTMLWTARLRSSGKRRLHFLLSQ